VGLIRDKMIEDMKLRGFADNTQQCYLQYARKYIAHYRRPQPFQGDYRVTGRSKKLS
jgi:hypothetical protein